MDDHLCVSCALCCNGTLFSRVPVTQAEASRLAGRMTFFRKPDGALRMRQPCPQLGSDGACGCYQDRPDGCRGYRCQLLKRVEAGEIPEPRARDIVNRLHGYQALAQHQAVAALPDPAKAADTAGAVPAMQALKRAAKADPDQVDPQQMAEARFHYDVFVRYVRLHLQPNFRKG